MHAGERPETPVSRIKHFILWEGVIHHASDLFYLRLIALTEISGLS